MNFDLSTELEVGTKLLRRNSPDSVALDLADAMVRKQMAGQHRSTSLCGESAETSDGSLPPPPSDGEKDNAALLHDLHIGGKKSDTISKSAQVVGTADDAEAYQVRKTRPASFRRDSIEHNKRQSPTRLRDDMPGGPSSSSSLPPTHYRSEQDQQNYSPPLVPQEDQAGRFRSHLLNQIPVDLFRQTQTRQLQRRRPNEED